MKRLDLIFVSCVVVISGCSKPTVVGKWKVDPAFASKDPAGVPAGFMTGFASTFYYDFKADNTFRGSSSEGTYTFDGKTIAVTTTKYMGADISKFGGNASKPQMTGELGADGKTMTLHPQVGSNLPQILKNVPMILDKG